MGLKLNLGCGEKILAGYVNCDVLPHLEVDRRVDLNVVPYPFEDACAEEILLDNVLEHLEDVPKVMAELHRVLQTGGRLRLRLPYAKTDWALHDPTHKHFFTERSMECFARGYPSSFYFTFKFHLVEARLFGESTTWRHRLRNLLPFKNVLRYFFWNIYDGVYFELEKL
jgi:predicted SAM-dependent methyltransferase